MSILKKDKIKISPIVCVFCVVLFKKLEANVNKCGTIYKSIPI